MLPIVIVILIALWGIWMLKFGGNASVEAERRLRSAPVLGRSNVQKSKGRENLNARGLMETAAPEDGPEDGRTPPLSLGHYPGTAEFSTPLLIAFIRNFL